MWPQIAREQLGAGNAGFATSWELPGSWEPGSLLRKDIAWEAILGIKTTACTVRFVAGDPPLATHRSPPSDPGSGESRL